MAYATTQQLADFMGILRTVPDRSLTKVARTRETIGTGNLSATVFWTDNAYVVDDSFTFEYGTTETASLTSLTETTDFTFDKSLGKITLSANAVTSVSADTIYGTYNYVIADVGITDAHMVDAIARAEKEIDRFTNNHFATGTDATPDWNQSLNEKQDGKGPFKRNYYTLQNYPIPDVSTESSTVTLSAVTITADSTAGFPSTGSILLESNKVTYTGKSSTTFTGCSDVIAHSADTVIKPYVVEISTTSPGGTISWDVLEEDTEFDLNKSTGRVHIYADGVDYSGTYTDIESSPLNRVANRMRTSYIYGNSTIPVDITKATLMLAAKDLMSLAVRKAHTAGLNDFNPTMFTIDEEELNRILLAYRNEQYSRC